MNVIQDLSALTKTKQQTFDYLIDLATSDISQCVIESWKSGNRNCVIDIGIGTLSVLFEDDEMHFKFIPSEELEIKITSAVLTGESSLQNDIENKIDNRMIKLYKELI